MVPAFCGVEQIFHNRMSHHDRKGVIYERCSEMGAPFELVPCYADHQYIVDVQTNITCRKKGDGDADSDDKLTRTNRIRIDKL